MPSQFVEEHIYDGFPTAGDVRLAALFHQCPWEERRATLDKMTDDRLRELGFRLFGIEAHDHLSLEEQAFFTAWQQSRRHGPVQKTFSLHSSRLVSIPRRRRSRAIVRRGTTRGGRAR